MGNKVVFKNYERAPIVSNEAGVLEVSVGKFCDPDAPDNSFKTSAPSAGNSVGHALAFVIPVALSATGVPAIAAAALGLASLGAIGKIPFAEAQVDVEACNLVPIEVEIYVDETVNSLVMQGAQSGDFEACPPESKHVAPNLPTTLSHFILLTLSSNQACTGSTTPMSSVDTKVVLERRATIHAPRIPKEYGKKMVLWLLSTRSFGMGPPV
jgi:hypothetical protein